MKEVIIVNPKELDKRINKFKEGKADKIHVLSDFDKTLTKFILPNGEQMPSLISRIRNGNYLSSEYSKEANELYNKYHPIEIDSGISFDEKKKLMYEWWKKHFELLGNSGLTKNVVDRVADDLINGEKIMLRAGVAEFINNLTEYNIPLVIISSSVGDLISSFLEKEGLLKNNVNIIANILDYDENGNFIRVKNIVHVFNKDETVLKDFPDVFKKVKKRKNVLLFGDSLGDLGMIEGFDYENLIKIGFLNENIKEDLELFKEKFDIVVTNDGTFDYVNELMMEILT